MIAQSIYTRMSIQTTEFYSTMIAGNRQLTSNSNDTTNNCVTTAGNVEFWNSGPKHSTRETGGLAFGEKVVHPHCQATLTAIATDEKNEQMEQIDIKFLIEIALSW